MELNEVQSSNIKRVGYNAEKEDLFVEYLSGALYRYKKVPKEVYDQLLESDSKGKFINTYIKGKYEYEKIK